MFWPIFIAACSFWGLALGGAFYLGRRYVRALERLAASNEQLAQLQGSLKELEAGLEPLATRPPGSTPFPARLPEVR